MLRKLIGFRGSDFFFVKIHVLKHYCLHKLIGFGESDFFLEKFLFSNTIVYTS